MSFDALTLTAVRHELEPALTDSRVQRLAFVDELSLAIECFRPGVGRTCVLLSAHPEHGRVQRVEMLPARGIEHDSPFALLARKHLRAARVRALSQPRLERVLELDCEQHDASGQHYRVKLIVEAMGRRGNLLLVDADGTIMDAARRSPPSRNPRRPVLPHLPYVAPPPQARLLPDALSLATIASIAASTRSLTTPTSATRPTAEGAISAPDAMTATAAITETTSASATTAPTETTAASATTAITETAPTPAATAPTNATSMPSPKLARFLSDNLAGLSPLAGRELAFRIGGSLDAPLDGVDWPHALAVVQTFFAPVDTRAWRPTVALRDDAPEAFASYALTHLAAAGATLRDFETISAAMTLFYAAERTRPRGDPLSAERRALLVSVDRALESTQRRVRALELQLESGQSQREPLRRAGELLLTHQAEVAPDVESVVLEGETIELDRHLSAVDNAQAYFARYRKAREAEERVPGLVEEARNHLEYLQELRAMVEVADQMDAIRALRREVASATAAGREPTTPQARGRAARGRPGVPHRRVPLADGWEALVGTSATGNAGVTFDLAQADDVWLHARGVAGAHVIVRRRGPEEPPDRVLERAAELAAWHSAARSSPRVEVDIAARRYVRKIPNAPPGLVRYSHERTLRVTPKSHSVGPSRS